MAESSLHCIPHMFSCFMATMKFHFLLSLALFYVVLPGGSNAALPAEEYWHSKLPNTPFPQELQKFLQPNMVDKPTTWILDPVLLAEAGNRKYKNKKYGQDSSERSSDASLSALVDGREKYGKRYGKGSGTATMEDGKTISETSKHESDASVSAFNEGREKYGKRYGKGFDTAAVEDGKTISETSKDDSDASIEALIDRREKYKRYSNNKASLPDSTIFFVYNDLHPGKKMKLHLTKSTNNARFLARQVSDSIPFSSNRLPEILKQFSVKPKSFEAKVIEQTIQECESPGIIGEDRFCPTSLESLLDFVVKHVGNEKVEVVYNQIEKPTKVQEYTITGVEMVGENQVVCHKQYYPYAVYYCHSITGTKVYMAELAGENGIKAKAVAVCHSETQNWNPGHLAFLMLKIKPGEATICHFIRSDTLAWVGK